MNRYKLTIAYDGTDYYGWQVQPGVRTIAGVLQHCFYKTFQKPCKLVGVSRTDTGVHALGQIAECRTEIDLSVNKLLSAWNNALPNDILIRSLEWAEDTFRLFKHVDYKFYYYHFFLQRPLPFIQRYGCFYRYPLNVKKLEQALQIFVGKHDFRSFCTGTEQAHTIRSINSIHIEHFKRYGIYRIAINGQSFLRYMIRRIVGAAFEVSSYKKIPIKTLQEALERRDPRQLLPTAPAKGLLLYKIIYKRN